MMIEDTNNQQVMVRYLLGLLSEAETARLDELSFTDEAFAASLRTTEDDLVDAYVQGDLRGVELEGFNAHYLATPFRRERVNFARSLQDWAARNPVSATAVGADEPAPRRKAAWWFSSLFATPRPALQWAIVATMLLLGALTAWLLVQNLRLRRQLTETEVRQNQSQQREQELQRQLESQSSANSVNAQELARLQREREQREGQSTSPQESKTSVLSFILGPPLRGGAQVRSLSIPAGTTSIKMELQLEPAADYPAYKVSLVDPASSQSLWHSGTIKVAGRKGKTLNITLPASLLKSQNYFLRVNGTTAAGQSEIVGDYAFRVVK